MGDGMRAAAARRWWPAAVALVAAVFVARSAWLWGERPGSWDEGESMRLATAGPGELADTLAERDVILMPYYLVARVWLLPWESLTWLRVLSLAAMTAAVVLVAVVGRRLYGPVAGLAAAGAMSWQEIVVDLGMTARGYALAVLCVVALAAVGRLRWLLGGGAVLLHLFALPAAVVVLAWRRDWRALALTGLVAAPVTAAALVQRGQVGWITQVPQRSAPVILVLAAGGVSLAALALFAGLWLRAWWLLAWWVAPTLLLAAASVVQPVLHYRYAVFTVPGSALLVGGALPAAWRAAQSAAARLRPQPAVVGQGR